MMNRAQHHPRTILVLALLCLLVGAALRLGNPMDWSFINDELSTWHKVSYDSVDAVVDNIKAVDSHPVGLYVGVYYWTQLFGTSEWAIKLPFFLLSLLSLWLVFRVGTLWFSRSVGLLAMACWATLQFPIWWSHIARQYQSGSFLTLAMVYCWTHLVLYRRTEKHYWAGWILLGAAACYNHYFSALFAGMVGLTGLFLIDAKRRGWYLLSGVAMLALFAPHVPITLYQAQNADGHLWYGVPTPDFFSQHLDYLTHYSVWVKIAVGFVALLGIGLSVRQPSITQPAERAPSLGTLRLVAGLWFVLPAVLGYWYSVTYSPILRPSHLLFSFPYGLLLVFSGWSQTEQPKALAAVVLLLLGINTATLIYTRHHFSVVHTHPYEHFITATQAFLNQHDREEVTIVLGENPDYLQYYKDAYEAPFEHHESFKPDIPFQTFQKLVASPQAPPYLIIGSLPPAHIQSALRHYPHVLVSKEGVNYEYYILAKAAPPNSSILPLICTKALPQQSNSNPHWSLDANGWQQDSTGAPYYAWSGEWGPTYNGALKELLPDGRDVFLDVHARLQSAADSVPLSGTLVVELLNDQDSSLLWRGVQVAEQAVEGRPWQDLYLSLRLLHEPVYRHPEPLNIRAYFWNHEKQVVHLARFDLCTRPNNQLLYKDTQRFE